MVSNIFYFQFDDHFYRWVGSTTNSICTSWYPKHPFFSGCFSWMIPFLYLKTGCFTKHPLKNGCLGFQDDSYWNEVYIQRRKGLGIGGNAVKNSRKCCRDTLVCAFMSAFTKKWLKTVEFFSMFLGNPSCLPYAGDSSSQPKSSRASKSKSSQLGSFGEIPMGLDIFGTLENTKLETQSSFQPLERWFLTEGNEKEGLADGRGFGEKKRHQVTGFGEKHISGVCF